MIHSTSANFFPCTRHGKTSLGKVNILVPIAATSTISALSSFEELDFGRMCYLIRPHSPCMWFLFRLPSTGLGSVQATQAGLLQCMDHSKPLPHQVRDFSHRDLFVAPFGTLNFMSYIHLSRRTQTLWMNRVLWARTFSCRLESLPQVINLKQGVAMCEMKG